MALWVCMHTYSYTYTITSFSGNKSGSLTICNSCICNISSCLNLSVYTHTSSEHWNNDAWHQSCGYEYCIFLLSFAFHGLIWSVLVLHSYQLSSLAVAPLCFLYHEPYKLYQIFREMYVRFFFRLHSISSHPSVSSSVGSTQTLNCSFLKEKVSHLNYKAIHFNFDIK